MNATLQMPEVGTEIYSRLVADMGFDPSQVRPRLQAVASVPPLGAPALSPAPFVSPLVPPLPLWVLEAPESTAEAVAETTDPVPGPEPLGEAPTLVAEETSDAMAEESWVPVAPEPSPLVGDGAELSSYFASLPQLPPIGER